MTVARRGDVVAMAGGHVGGFGLARGCCSAIKPCAHQQRDWGTICEQCAKAQAEAKAREQAEAGKGD
jgi:hypothetical protein